MKRTVSDTDKQAAGANGHAGGLDDGPQEIHDRARSRSIKWDEANLEENDKIKAELKPVKINEPKTPYHGPLDMDGLPDEEETDMAPLTLEEAPSANGRSLSRSPRSGDGAGEEGAGGGASARRSVSQDTSASSWSNWSTEDSEAESSAHKRRRFQLLRREHYDMRQALAKGKQLAEKDLKTAEEAGGEGEMGESGEGHQKPSETP
ncbi:hypothetical protein WJX81_007163 [Elliptochloris bilobata]|uniref:Protein phosphatase inhibitor 2 n=1 Tax=Elliptochloris bilobata TaxID=381761 RepID=A0AAW1QVP1_9CHLO